MKRATILNVELSQPESQEPELVPEESFLLSGIAVFRHDMVFGFADSSLRKDPSLGRFFPELRPDSNGEFEIELGAALPDFLPNLDRRQEYKVAVAIESGIRDVFVSNRMRQVTFASKGMTYQAVFPANGESLLRKEWELDADNVPSVGMRSTVTTRFRIKGKDAEDSLELHLESCIQQFVACLNRLLSACHKLDDTRFGHYSINYDRTTFPWFNVVIRGEDLRAWRHFRIVSHVGRVSFMGPNLSPASESEMKTLLAAPEDRLSPQRFFASARAARESGLNQMALLQAVISSEIATAHYIKKRLVAEGMSNSKWDSYKTDITYSQMLNVFLTALTPSGKKPDSAVIGALNRARSLRNGLMHEGNEEMREGEIDQILEATLSHLDYLEQLP